MNGAIYPDITSKIFYLERSLEILRKGLFQTAKKSSKAVKSLYGSLPNLKLSFQEIKSVRKNLSSSWEKEWS